VFWTGMLVGQHPFAIRCVFASQIFRKDFIVVKMSFDELKVALVEYKARSFIKQGAIVILRSIFKEKEEFLKTSHNTAMDEICESCGEPKKCYKSTAGRFFCDECIGKLSPVA